jgi:hypothetical protein
MAKVKRTNGRNRLEQRQAGRHREQSAARSADLAKALGASRTFRVSARPHGPFAVAALLDEVKNRLISRGGRPSDPSPTVRRLVPLKKKLWKRLQAQARHLSDLGKPVSPGQLAALLLERTIDELEAVTSSRPVEPPLRAAPDAP